MRLRFIPAATCRYVMWVANTDQIIKHALVQRETRAVQLAKWNGRLYSFNELFLLPRVLCRNSVSDRTEVLD